MMLRIVLFVGALCLFSTASTSQTLQWEDFDPISTLVVEENELTRSVHPFIDVHGHQWGIANYSADRIAEVVAAMDAMNMGMMVNLSGGSGESLAQAVTNTDTHAPGRFVHFANLSFDGISHADWGEKAAAQLAEDFSNGAVGLKIFKNLGMTVVDSNNVRVPTDDLRLDPVWAMAGQLGIPVLIHTADPPQFWLPHDRFNERWFELKERPNRKRPPEPTWQELIDEQWNVFRKHPETKFFNAHLGWLGGDLERLGQLMDEFPNMYTELGAVVAELGRQPHTARKWLIKYQDRVVMGKDSWNPPEYHTYFRVLETADEFFPYYRLRHAWWRMYGLNLPDEVLRKIYYKNALRLIPGMDASRFPSDWNLDVVDAPVQEPVALARGNLGNSYVKVHYRPSLREGQEIFGGLIPYGERWYMDGDMPAEITFTQPVTIGDGPVAAGTYSLYTIPGEYQWSVIINADLGQTSGDAYREEADVVLLQIVPEKLDQIHEALTMTFNEVDAGLHLVLTWEQMRISVPITAP